MEAQVLTVEKVFAFIPLVILIIIWIIAFILLTTLVFESKPNRLPRFAAMLSSSILCYYLYLKNLLYDYFLNLSKSFSDFRVLSVSIIVLFGFGILLGWLLAISKKAILDIGNRIFIGITSFYLGVVIINFCKSKFLITPFSEFTLFPSMGILSYYAYLHIGKTKEKERK